MTDETYGNDPHLQEEEGGTWTRLDTENLKARFAGKPQLLQKLYHEFSNHIQDAVPAMRSDFEANDLKSMEKRAHTLKGNAALIGAVRVSNLAFEVERASARGDVQVLDSSVPQLANEAESTLNELENFVRDHG